MLEPFTTKHPLIPNVYLIELKYIARSQRADVMLQQSIEKAREQAEVQLNQYEQDEALQRRSHGLSIRKLVLVFYGWELKLCKECSA